MKSASDYLDSTETAVVKLLEGIDSYLAILEKGVGVEFSGSFSSDIDADQFEEWRAANAEAIAERRRIMDEYSAQSFALSTLAGSILQVAAKGIEWFSEGGPVPSEYEGLIKGRQAKFCVGDVVHGVKSGLIIYAGRNQFAHMNDPSLSALNEAIFDHLARGHGVKGMGHIKDPMFDLENETLTVYSANITGILGWRGTEGYSQYRSQMEYMLGI